MESIVSGGNNQIKSNQFQKERIVLITDGERRFFFFFLACFLVGDDCMAWCWWEIAVAVGLMKMEMGKVCM